MNIKETVKLLSTDHLIELGDCVKIEFKPEFVGFMHKPVFKRHFRKEAEA